MDVGADEVQAKRVKDFAAKFFNRVEDEKTAIKMAFSQWKVDSSTRELKLDGTQMTPVYLSVLEDVLELGQYPFTSLYMRKCFLNDQEMAIIAPMLDNNTKIKKVCWSSNAITDQGMNVIADMMEYNRTLEEVDVRENHITADSAPRLYQAILANPTIQVVNSIPIRNILQGDDSLSGTLTITQQLLGPLDAALLSLAFMDMKNPHTLTSLDLSGNKLTYRAIDVLIPGLLQVKGLKSLDLSKNLFYMEGAESLAYYLSNNRTLTSLKIADCDICKGGECHYGAEALRDAVMANKALVELDLTGNKVRPSIESRIRDSLRVNRSLLYNSTTQLEDLIRSKLPPVPTFDHPPDLDYRIPSCDEKFLKKEKYVPRDFVIEPQVEVVPKRKKQVNDTSSSSSGGGGLASRMAVTQGLRDLLRGGQGVVNKAKGVFGTTTTSSTTTTSTTTTGVGVKK